MESIFVNVQCTLNTEQLHVRSFKFQKSYNLNAFDFLLTWHSLNKGAI